MATNKNEGRMPWNCIEYAVKLQNMFYDIFFYLVNPKNHPIFVTLS